MSEDFGFYPRTGFRGLGRITSMHRETERSPWAIFWEGVRVRCLKVWVFVESSG
jgi:hypothetical protein